ncbi:MAG: FG-GAP-like repeat-containing protein [Acidobacteriota bacterium]|nr:FG-GAP-like repeat-containing protein [Acidobacteriota bacterium]
MPRNLSALLLLVALVPAAASAQPTEEQVRLHGIGYAQLENEREVEAESTYRELIELVPDEPLGHANLAVALLRQDRKDAALAAVDRALELGGNRADLLLIRGDILQWSSRHEEALVEYRRAASTAPDDPETQYALFRHADIMSGPQAEVDRRTAVDRLRRLRPDNLVVLLLSGEAALGDGDRGRASDDYLRVRELIWQAQPSAERVVEEVLDALEADDLERGLSLARRVTNVMKGTTAWTSSHAEIFTNIPGIPVERFVDESPIEDFGPALPVRFRATRIDNAAAAGRALEVADFDGDDRPDIAWVAGGDGSEAPLPQLQLRRASVGHAASGTALETDARLLVAGDADNDRRLDLVAVGDPLAVWQVDTSGATPRFGNTSDRFLAQPFAVDAADLIDFDSDGDLDLAVARTGGGPDLLRNVSGEGVFEGPLEALGPRALPQVEPRRFHHLQATDADRDGDTDLLLAHDAGVLWLDNLRQGRFAERTPPAPAGNLLGRLVGRLLGDDAEPALATGTPVRVVRTADLDRDGIPEFVLAGASTAILRAGEHGALAPFPLTSESVGLPTGATDLALLDADNDGRRDLALVADGELRVLTQTSDSGPEALEFQLAQVTGLPRDAGFSAVRADDLDGDGDQDLVAAGAAGLYRIENLNGSENNWLRVRLVGLDIGNQKNNVFGRGTTIEVKSERAYQYVEVDRPVTHIGLGNRRRPDLVRVVWANGVPQNRLEPGENMTIVEEQVLKGSCPFLYTWDGEKVTFVTDLLWGAPLGMPLADGVWNGYDPDELVRVDGARTRDGFYDLRITEELWEAAYIDRVRLWVVDHREGAEVASNLRIVPGRGHVGRPPDEVVASAEVRPVAQATDGRGRDVTERVRARDEVYGDGYRRSRFQGHAAEPWTFTFDLGEAPGKPVRLWLDGWVFPADASLNLAIAQAVEHGDLEMVMTRLEVETGDGWQTLLDPMGFPPGKTKTMVVDTPPLPAGARKLRIVTTRWLHWDRVAWSSEPDGVDGDGAVVQARLNAASADLSYRGFSAPTRPAPNGPHLFDYQRTSAASPWLPFPGRYTRFGDVVELLADVDDRQVVIGPGDEIRVLFDARELPPPAPGYVRTVFLESFGWDKDADRNTWKADSNLPLPFRAMSGYPFGPGESYPRTPELDAYRTEWLTRAVGPETPFSAAAAPSSSP